jgi:hypothetical protein
MSRSPPSSLNAVTCPITFHVCFWNGVRRFRGIGRGYGRARIASIVVGFGSSCTAILAGSLRVFRRHKMPPHCSARGSALWRPIAVVAAIAASAKRTMAMSAARFIAIFGPTRTSLRQNGTPMRKARLPFPDVRAWRNWQTRRV